jgi:hypothetical protein
MRKNVLVIIVITFLSIMTAVASTLPSTWMEFLPAFGLSFVVWFLLLVPAIDISPGKGKQ